MLSTAFFTGSLFLCLVSVAAAVVAYWYARAAAETAEDLRRSRGKVDANEASIAQLHGQYMSLRGYVYQLKQRRNQPPADELEPNETPDQVRARLRKEHGLPRIGGTNGKAPE